MTERGLPIVDGAPACPFVAFEDDRDERATSPDHRHRCYAEPRPAPRALAHQEAYCLSSAFPVCPTFQDWARREAAHSRSDGPRLTDSAVVGDLPTPQRNPPRNWSAPPPWAPRPEHEDDDEEDWAAEAAAAAAAGEAAGAEPGDEVPARGRGLSGSFADRVASGTSEAELGAMEAGADGQPSSTSRGSPEEARAQHERGPDRATVEGASTDRGGSPARHERRRDSNAPEWERARPLEVYPTLRSRRLPELSVPPLLVAVVALALAAAVLFALPGLLGFGSPSAVSSPTPSAASSLAAASLAPTPIPEPTPVTYVVKSGDTMSKIAKRFGVSLDDLIAANATTIPDPDKLAIGDVVIIPVPASNELPDASGAPAPS